MKNQSGFSLLQVIFASTVLGALSLQGLKMMKEQEKLALITTQRFEIKYIQDEMIEILKNPRSCRKTFEGLTKSSMPKIKAVTQVFNDPNTNQESLLPQYFTFEESERLYGQNSLKIHEYNVSFTAPSRLTLEIVFDRMESGQYSRFFSREIALIAQFDQQGNLKECTLPVTSFIQSDWTIENQISAENVFAIKPQDSHSLQIGERSYNALISVDSLIRASWSKKSLPECHDNNKASLLYHEPVDRYYFCQNGEWRDLNAQSLNPQNVQEIKLGDGDNQQAYVEARLCLLQSARTQSAQDRCEMSPAIDQTTLDLNKRPWSLFVRRISNEDQVQCHFRCYL